MNWFTSAGHKGLENLLMGGQRLPSTSTPWTFRDQVKSPLITKDRTMAILWSCSPSLQNLSSSELFDWTTCWMEDKDHYEFRLLSSYENEMGPTGNKIIVITDVISNNSNTENHLCLRAHFPLLSLGSSLDTLKFARLQPLTFSILSLVQTKLSIPHC